MRSTPIGILAAAAVLTAACGDDPAAPQNAFEVALTEDLAMVAADATLDDLAAMNDAVGGDGSTSTGGSFSRVVSFFDAAGNLQESFDPLTTDVVEVVVDAEREATRSGWVATFQHHREFSISGLAGEETTRTRNGAGQTEITRSSHSDTGGDRSYEMSSTSLIQDVVVGVPRAEFPWPLSGTITREIEATITTPDGVRTRQRTVVVDFNGTQFAEMTVNGETFELDLDARDFDRPFRRVGNR
ncbi:MAG: hypothetical protein ABFS34_12100 [Gemmatimonadota bacterium]